MSTADRPIAALVLALLVVAVVAGCDSSRPSTNEAQVGRTGVVLFAAASTIDVMTALARQYEQRTNVKVRCNFAASSTLARQIESGADAGVFVSANSQWMDHLAQRGRIRPASRFRLMGNELVLIVPRNSKLRLRLDANDPVAETFADKRLAMGDPTHVPAGMYGQQALEALGWWPQLQRQIVPTLDVRSALQLVELGEVDAGIVYATDAAAAADKVRIAGVFSPDMHEPIRYDAALCATATSADEAFIAYLRRPEARALLMEAGFKG